MSELRSFLRTSLEGPQSEMTEITQAHMVIPIGTVRNVCQTLEHRISKHQYERDKVYIRRATRNMMELIGQNRTYAEQLRNIENATLFDLPIYLIDFLRDHENLYRAALRSRLAAREAIACPCMDIFTQVKCRLLHIRIIYFINIIETTRSEAEHRRLMNDSLFVKEFRECTESLQDEIFRQLTRFEQLLSNPRRDSELENVGPDHDVDDFGLEIPLTRRTTASDDRDQSQRCIICLESYTTTHAAFSITDCEHTVGKPCLARWLNSTSRNANLCPYCRKPLCDRRTRRLAVTTLPMVSEHRSVFDRWERAITMIDGVEKMYGELFGAELATEYITQAMEALNYRLFENDVGFCLICEGLTSFRWVVRRMRWH